MKLREALIQQAPSLALQRAAADEIARLDARVRELEEALEDFVQEFGECRLTEKATQLLKEP